MNGSGGGGGLGTKGHTATCRRRRCLFCRLLRRVQLRASVGGRSECSIQQPFFMLIGTPQWASWLQVRYPSARFACSMHWDKHSCSIVHGAVQGNALILSVSWQGWKVLSYGDVPSLSPTFYRGANAVHVCTKKSRIRTLEWEHIEIVLIFNVRRTRTTNYPPPFHLPPTCAFTLASFAVNGTALAVRAFCRSKARCRGRFNQIKSSTGYTTVIGTQRVRVSAARHSV